MGRRRKDLKHLKLSKGQTSPLPLTPEEAHSPRKVAPLRISLQSDPPKVKIKRCVPCTLEPKATAPSYVDLRSKTARKEAWIISQESKGINRKAIEAEDKRIDTLFSKLPKPKKSYFLRELSADDIRSIPMKGEKQKTAPSLEYVEGDTRPGSPCPPFEKVTPPSPPSRRGKSLKCLKSPCLKCLKCPCLKCLDCLTWKRDKLSTCLPSKPQSTSHQHVLRTRRSSRSMNI